MKAVHGIEFHEVRHRLSLSHICGNRVYPDVEVGHRIPTHGYHELAGICQSALVNCDQADYVVTKYTGGLPLYVTFHYDRGILRLRIDAQQVYRDVISVRIAEIEIGADEKLHRPDRTVVRTGKLRRTVVDGHGE